MNSGIIRVFLKILKSFLFLTLSSHNSQLYVLDTFNNVFDKLLNNASNLLLLKKHKM